MLLMHVPSSAMIDSVSITVDEPLAVDSVPANVFSVPAPVVVDPAPIIVDEPPVELANAPVSDPALVTEPVSPVPDVPVTATNISVEPPYMNQYFFRAASCDAYSRSSVCHSFSCFCV